MFIFIWMAFVLMCHFKRRRPIRFSLHFAWAPRHSSTVSKPTEKKTFLSFSFAAVAHFYKCSHWRENVQIAELWVIIPNRNVVRQLQFTALIKSKSRRKQSKIPTCSPKGTSQMPPSDNQQPKPQQYPRIRNPSDFISRHSFEIHCSWCRYKVMIMLDTFFRCIHTTHIHLWLWVVATLFLSLINFHLFLFFALSRRLGLRILHLHSKKNNTILNEEKREKRERRKIKWENKCNIHSVVVIMHTRNLLKTTNRTTDVKSVAFSFLKIYINRAEGGKEWRGRTHCVSAATPRH